MKTPGLLITIIGSAVFIAVMWVWKEGLKLTIAGIGWQPVLIVIVLIVVSGLIYDQWSRRPPNER